MKFTSSFSQMGVSNYRMRCFYSIIESQRPGMLCNQVKLMHFLFAPSQLWQLNCPFFVNIETSINCSESSILHLKKGYKNELHGDMLFVLCCGGRARKVVQS